MVMRTAASRLTAVALDVAGRALVEVWNRPALADALAAATGWGIAYERVLRSSVRPWARSPHRPAVTWHESGHGPPLLLLNGFTGSGLTWPRAWVGALAERFRVIRINNRGTGWSREAPVPFTIADMADDAYDVLRTSGAGPAVVLGLSMGGMIAQELALRHSEYVKQLVLVATIPPAPAFVVAPHGIALSSTMFVHSVDGRRDATQPDEQALAQYAGMWRAFASHTFEPEHGVLDEMSRQTLSRATPRRSAFMQARAINAWRGPARLAGIAAPTTVVHGANDRVVPVANAERIASLVPGADLRRLPSVGHLVPWEAGDELRRIIGD